MVVRALVFGTVAAWTATAGLASAADYLKPYHRASHHRSRDLFAYGDRQRCPREEPLDYKPRIENFQEPLCYAARPYGISPRLYDYALNLDERGDY